MKALGSRTPACHRCSIIPKVGACCYAAVIVHFFRHGNSDSDCGSRTCFLPGAKSFQYDDLIPFHSRESVSGTLSSYSRSLIIGARGEKKIYVEIKDNQTIPSQSVSLQKMRMIRGGVDDEDRDDVDINSENGGKQRGDSVSNLESDPNEILCAASDADHVSIAAHTALNNEKSSSHFWIDRGNKSRTKLFSSLLSIFRTNNHTSNNHLHGKVTNKPDIVQKIPHGPDGRGGGGVMFSTPLTQDIIEPEGMTQERDFRITTETVEIISTNATFERAKSLSTSAETQTELVSRLREDSTTAFVIPPSRRNLSFSVDNGEGKGPKNRKPSKTKEEMGDKVEGETMHPSSNSTRYKADVIASSNDTSAISTSKLVMSDESLAEQASDGPGTSQLEDYTSSGHVSVFLLMPF